MRRQRSTAMVSLREGFGRRNEGFRSKRIQSHALLCRPRINDMRGLNIQYRAWRSVIGASSDPRVRGMANGTSQRSRMASVGTMVKVEGMKRDFQSPSTLASRL